jgi:hypothetical protein
VCTDQCLKFVDSHTGHSLFPPRLVPSLHRNSQLFIEDFLLSPSNEINSGFASGSEWLIS